MDENELSKHAENISRLLLIEKRKKKYLKMSEPSPTAIPHALHLLTRSCIPIVGIKQQTLSPPHWRPFEH